MSWRSDWHGKSRTSILPRLDTMAQNPRKTPSRTFGKRKAGEVICMKCEDCKNFELKEPKKVVNGTWKISGNTIGLFDENGDVYIGRVLGKNDTSTKLDAFMKYDS